MASANRKKTKPQKEDVSNMNQQHETMQDIANQEAAELQAKAEAAAEAARVKEEQKAAQKAAKELAKAERKAVKAAEASERAAKKEAEKTEKEAEKLRKAKEKAEAREAARVAKEASRMPESNGVRRPKPHTLCGKAWQVFDDVSAGKGAPAAISECMDMSAEQGLNPGNVRVEYARWKKFYGITGRVAVAAAEANEEIAQEAA